MTAANDTDAGQAGATDFDVAKAAATTVRLVEQLAVDAVRYAEAYGHDGRALVVDGTQYAPATRALPGAAQVWERSDGTWLEYDELVDAGIQTIEVPEHTDGEPGMWTLMWDLGCLMAVAPDADPDD